jgi:hypothetical protein
VEHSQFRNFREYSRRPTIRGQKVLVEESDESGDVMFENLPYGTLSRFARFLTSVLATILMEVVASMAIYFLLLLRQRFGEIGSLWTGTVVAIINTLTRQMITKASKHERLHTKSAISASRLAKVLVLELTTIGLTIAINFNIREIWEDDIKGWAVHIAPIFLGIVGIETAQRCLVVLFNPVWRVKVALVDHNFFMSKREKEALLLGPVFDEVYAYSSSLRVLLFSVIISPVFPLGWLTCVGSETLCFAASRYMLLAHCAQPVRGDFKLANALRNIFLISSYCSAAVAGTLFFVAGKSPADDWLDYLLSVLHYGWPRAVYPLAGVVALMTLVVNLILLVRLLWLISRWIHVILHVIFCGWLCFDWPGTREVTIDENELRAYPEISPNDDRVAQYTQR